MAKRRGNGLCSLWQQGSCLRRCGILVACIVGAITLFAATNDYFYYDILHANVSCFPPLELRREVAHVIHSFDEVMQKLGLTYWLIHGSLLGAVRYQGMLPWDYDGDLGYLLQDQEKIVSLVPSELRRYNISFRSKPNRPYFLLEYGNAYVDLIPYAPYGSVRGLHHWNFSYYKNDTIVRVYEPTDVYYRLFGCRNAQHEMIFPLVPCRFQGKEVRCPHEAPKVLSEFYCWSYGLGVNVPYKFDCWKPWNLWHIWWAKKHL